MKKLSALFLIPVLLLTACAAAEAPLSDILDNISREANLPEPLPTYEETATAPPPEETKEIRALSEEPAPDEPELGALSDITENAGSEETESLEKWLENNLWDIIGNSYLISDTELRGYVIPRSAQLAAADIDGDGVRELIHILYTRTYDTVISVYKFNGSGLNFYGYFFSGNHDGLDGVYERNGEYKYVCTSCETSGSAGQPYWVQIFEMKLSDDGVELIPAISAEWQPSAADSTEQQFYRADRNGETTYSEEEYSRWLEDNFGGWTRTGDILEYTDFHDAPFSIGFKDIMSDDEVKEIISWICGIWE